MKTVSRRLIVAALGLGWVQAASAQTADEIVGQAPNKSRTLIKLDLSAFGAGQMVFDQRFDGTSGYVLDSLQGNRDMTGDQLEAMRNSSFPSPYLNYKEL